MTYLIILLGFLLCTSIAVGLGIAFRLNKQILSLQQDVKIRNARISSLYREINDLEQQTKLSMFRVGTMFNVLNYIRKIKDTEDPKHYLEASANMAADAINKCKMTVRDVGDRMANF